MAGHCSLMSITGRILNLKNVMMSYVKYERDIVAKHKVQLLGWPTTIKFANPSEIGTIDDIRKLRLALRGGDCKWVVQSKRQQVAHAENLAAREAAGDPGVKKRKERSDKGKTRGKGNENAAAAGSGEKGGKRTRDDNNDGNGGSDNGDDERPRPKKKRKSAVTSAARKLPPAPKSRPFIDTDSEGED